MRVRVSAVTSGSMATHHLAQLLLLPVVVLLLLLRTILPSCSAGTKSSHLSTCSTLVHVRGRNRVGVGVRVRVGS